ncbi:MAG: hypothetical protein JOZ41_09370, partial [Chloroflexi bacterium]|nr:hypothetical protein [Chloroflexota bacterium]
MLDVAATILASITFNLSLALQAVDTRSSSTSLSFRPALLFYLLRQPLWLAGSFLGLVAVALQLYALSRLPLSFVQTVIAAGVLVLPVAARLLLKEPLSARILLASVVVVGGVAALSAGLPGETAHVPPVAPPLLLVAAVLGMAVFLLLRGLNDPRLLCLVAGCGYG